MTDREKLITLVDEAVYAPHAEVCAIVDHLIANGVTVKDRLIEKLVVINKKYNNIRCPSCDTVLGASYHYCFQCGQKVIHKFPQLPEEAE